jgi:hypothetical protein
MKENPVQLGARERQIADLLLQGCENAEIARQLKMARRTVKAHFNRMFLRFGISSGIKRVKLATLLYRKQLGLEVSSTRAVKKSSTLLKSSRKDSKTAKLREPSGLRRTSLRTTSASSKANLEFGIESHSPSRTKPAA